MKITLYSIPKYGKNARSILTQVSGGAFPSLNPGNSLGNIYFPLGVAVHEMELPGTLLNPTYRQNYAIVENDNAAMSSDTRKYGYFITSITWALTGALVVRFEIDGLFYPTTHSEKFTYKVSSMVHSDNASAGPNLTRFDLAKTPSLDFERTEIHRRTPIYDGLAAAKTYLRHGWVLICRKAEIDDDDTGFDRPVNGLYFYIMPYDLEHMTADTYPVAWYAADPSHVTRYAYATSFKSLDPDTVNDDNTLFVKWLPFLPFNATIHSQVMDPGGIAEETVMAIDIYNDGSPVPNLFLVRNLAKKFNAIRLETDVFDKEIELVSSSDVAYYFDAPSDSPLPITQPYIVDGNNRLPLLPFWEFLKDNANPPQPIRTLRMATRLAIQSECQLYFTRTGSGIDPAILYERGFKLDLVDFDLKSDTYLNWLRQNGANLAVMTALSQVAGIAQLIAGVAMGNPILAIGGGTSMASSAYSAYNSIERAKNTPDQVSAGKNLMTFAMRLISGTALPAIVSYTPIYATLEDFTIAARVGVAYNLDASSTGLMSPSYRKPSIITIAEIIETSAPEWSDIERAEAQSRIGSPLRIVSLT